MRTLPAKTRRGAEGAGAVKPDGLNFATLGNGSFPDLFRVWLNNQWGTKIVGVPYKGGGPAAQALAAGEVQMTRFGVGNFRGAMDAGKVRALAITADQRSKLMPDVPTFKEAGLDYPGQGWWGLAAPKGTPAADRRQGSRRVRGSCSTTLNSSHIWSSNRWCRRSPRRRLRRVPEGRPQGGGGAGQDREHAEDRIQAGEVGRWLAIATILY